MIRKVLFAAALALSAAAAPAAYAAQELLVNGSFEDLGAAVPEGWGGYTYYFGGAVGLPGWEVTTGSVDVTTDVSPWRPAYDGYNSLDINGWSAGGITQSFDTVLGKIYNVTFAYSRNLGGAPDPALALVSAGGQFRNVSAANDGSFGTPGNMLWKLDSFSFVGTGAPQSITLAAVTGGNGGVFFDKVSVMAVPEPGTWALMILGFGGAGAMLRRRRLQLV